MHKIVKIRKINDSTTKVMIKYDVKSMYWYNRMLKVCNGTIGRQKYVMVQ
jgi:hypothetical protein